MPLGGDHFVRIKKVSEARGPTGGQEAGQAEPAPKGRQARSCLGANNYTMPQEFPVQLSAKARFIPASTA